MWSVPYLEKNISISKKIQIFTVEMTITVMAASPGRPSSKSVWKLTYLVQLGHSCFPFCRCDKTPEVINLPREEICFCLVAFKSFGPCLVVHPLTLGLWRWRNKTSWLMGQDAKEEEKEGPGVPPSSWNYSPCDLKVPRRPLLSSGCPWGPGFHCAIVSVQLPTILPASLLSLDILFLEPHSVSAMVNFPGDLWPSASLLQFEMQVGTRMWR